MKKLTLERLKLQSRERLKNRQLERKMLQFNSRQAMKFGKRYAEDEDGESDDDLINVADLQREDPEALKDLTLRVSTAKDPGARAKKANDNAWNSYNDLAPK